MALWIFPSFFFIALAYSMVGLGGGSSYLAILTFSGLDYHQIAPTALACNIAVTAIGSYHFARAGYFRPKLLVPFIITSIPMAYLGGRLSISREHFCILLGISLLIASIRMYFPLKASTNKTASSNLQLWCIALPAGALLGFLAGIVGIGGGIFLSPLLLFLGWVTIREASAIASVFILINSLGGLAGQAMKGYADFSMLLPLLFFVFIGGLMGSQLGSKKMSPLILHRLLASLILYVSLKLLVRGL